MVGWSETRNVPMSFLANDEIAETWKQNMKMIEILV